MPSLYELLPSQEYFNHTPFYASLLKYNILNFGVKSDLNYNQTKQFLKDSSLNSSLIDQAESFHSLSYDNFDFSTTGIQAYNIVGCQEPTIDHITFKDFGPPKETLVQETVQFRFFPQIIFLAQVLFCFGI